MHAREAVSKSDWLGQAIARRKLQNELDRGVQAYAVSDGHEDRPRGTSRAAQCSPVVNEVRPTAALRPGFLKSTYQPRLSNTDCGYVGEHTDMAGQSEKPRMRKALPVD